MTAEEFNKQLKDLDARIGDSMIYAGTAKSAPGSPTAEWWSTKNAMTMSSTVLVFGVLVIGICAWLMRDMKPSADSILKVFGTVLIITGALFLVVAGYSDQQMAPVMGLLGTLAGYLLGKNAGSGSGDDAANAPRQA